MDRYETINSVLYDSIRKIGYETYYISPTKDAKFPYIAFSYEENEKYSYRLKLSTWTNNSNIVELEDMLSKIRIHLDKKIIFKKYSFRFYYETKTEILEIEGSEIVGREIFFDLRII